MQDRTLHFSTVSYGGPRPETRIVNGPLCGSKGFGELERILTFSEDDSRLHESSSSEDKGNKKCSKLLKRIRRSQYKFTQRFVSKYMKHRKRRQTFRDAVILNPDDFCFALAFDDMDVRMDQGWSCMVFR